MMMKVTIIKIESHTNSKMMMIVTMVMTALRSHKGPADSIKHKG